METIGIIYFPDVAPLLAQLGCSQPWGLIRPSVPGPPRLRSDDLLSPRAEFSARRVVFLAANKRGACPPACPGLSVGR